MTGVGAIVALGAVPPLTGITRVAPEAVVTTRVVRPPGWWTLIAATGVACLLTALMYITENGSQAAMIAAAPRASTRRYREDRRRPAP